jgi:tetratricopeptide (TPR) repeat protein
MAGIFKKASRMPIIILFCISPFAYSQYAEEFYAASQDLVEKGEYQLALGSIDKALAIDSSKVNYYLLRANIHFKLEQYDKTIKDCYRAIKLKNDIPEIYILRGKVCQVTESYGGAILFFGKAIKYSSENDILFDAFLNRGKAYFKLKKFSEAKSDFISAYDINPESVDLLVSMSENYLRLKDKDNALSNLRTAIEIDPSYPPAYELLGRIAIDDKEYQEAIIVYNKYCDLLPESASAHNKLGEAYLLNAEYDNAMNTLNMSQTLKPEDPMIFKLKGQVYIKMMEQELGCNNLFRAMQMGYLEQYGFDLLDIYLDECEDL